jgi:hypothetical protein
MGRDRRRCIVTGVTAMLVGDGGVPPVPLSVLLLFGGVAGDQTINVTGASGQTAESFLISPTGGSGSYPTESYTVASGSASLSLVTSTGTFVASASTPATITTAAVLYIAWTGLSVGATAATVMHANVTDSASASASSSNENIFIHRVS